MTLDENAEYFAKVQARLDRMTKSARERRLQQFRKRRKLWLSELPEYIALLEGVSVIRAAEMAMERLRDDSLKATARIGSFPRARAMTMITGRQRAPR